jgi:S1-C subfamily serine protease
MPQWVVWLNSNWFAIVGPILIFVAFCVGAVWARRVAYGRFHRLARQSTWRGSWQLLEATYRPFLQFILLVGLQIATHVSRLPPGTKTTISKVVLSLFIFFLVWMLVDLSQRMVKFYLPQIRQYLARTKAPQPSTPLLLNVIGAILVVLGLLALLDIWNIEGTSGILILAAVVVIVALVLRDALTRISQRIHMRHGTRKRLTSIGKLFLALLAIAVFIELTRRGYIMFAGQTSSNLNVVIFLLEIGLLVLVISGLRSNRFRWAKPSFKVVLLSVVVIASVCAFAGIQPLTSYKDATLNFVGNGWQLITSHITGGGDVASAIAKAEPAVVRVETTDSTGSGMVIDRSGYVLTCNHVVEDVQSVTIVFMSGEQYAGTVFARDDTVDLAIVRVTPDEGDLPTVTLGSSDGLHIGQDIIVIGYPLGLEGEVTVSRGIVSAFRSIDDVNHIQTDAAINPGNSGGPVVDLKGEVVGIADLKVVSEAVEGMNFAIAIDDAKTFVTNVLTSEQAQEQAKAEEQALLGLETEILRLINVERQERGIQPVVWSEELHNGARVHSQDMQQEGSLYHDTKGMFAECCYGATYVSPIYATAEATVQAWMTSTAGHRQILLDPQYRLGAVGVARDNGFWATYRCY